jgi:hypothetical protein
VDGNPSTDDGGTSGSSSLPCDVDAVLAANCRTCHTQPPQFGAPMPLVTWDDTQSAAKEVAGEKVYQRIGERIHDNANPMPPSPNPRLSASDTATLDAWIAAGAPKRTGGSCSNPPPPPIDAGVPTTQCTPNEHLAGASPWAMPQNLTDEYVCYGVDVTRTQKNHVIGMAPRIQNTKIVHHMLLFQAPTSVSSTPTPCALGGAAGWKIVYGWAPGGTAMDMPDAAGFPEDTGTTHYVVQVHYNNIAGLSGQTDASGMDLCATTQLRANDADVVAFGTENISIPPHGTLDKTCSYTIAATVPPLTVFAALPHMHKLGTVIATQTAAGVDLGQKNPFSFQSQSWVPVTATLKGGDVVKTRCAWNNTTDTTVTFGENTENEMCYSFTMYYPRLPTLPSWALPATLSHCQ